MMSPRDRWSLPAVFPETACEDPCIHLTKASSREEGGKLRVDSDSNQFVVSLSSLPRDPRALG